MKAATAHHPAATPAGNSVEPVPAEARELLTDESDSDIAPTLQLPRIVRKGRDLILENDAALPTRICVRSARPAYREIPVSLREPSNPLSWFGPRPRVRVGLSRRQWENHTVAVAMTWSFLGVGSLLLLSGILTSALITSVVGLVTAGVAGLFRAWSPVTGEKVSDHAVRLRGAGDGFLRQVDAVVETEEAVGG